MHDRLSRRRCQFEVHCKQIVEANFCSSGDILKIFVITRKILDSIDNPEPYKATRLYCNWLLHDHLSRRGSHWMLEEMSKVVVEYSGDTDGIFGAVSNSFGLAKMREEMKKLHEKSFYKKELFETDGNWELIVTSVLREIVHTPIGIPIDAYFRKGPFHKCAKKLVKKYGGLAISRISIIDDAEDTGVPGRPEGLYWELRLLSQPNRIMSEENDATINGHFYFSKTLD